MRASHLETTAAYQIAYIDTLKRELDHLTKEFDQLLTHDLPALNDSLKAKGQQPLSPPPKRPLSLWLSAAIPLPARWIA